MKDRVGVDPLRVSVMEDNSGAYLDWHATKARRRILVHVDSHLDAERVEEGRLRRLRAAKSPAALRRLERDPYDNRMHLKVLDLKNYVFHAARNGMLLEMWWVVPEKSPEGLAERYRQDIRESALWLTAAEAKSMTASRGTLTMELYGMRLSVCRVEDLPRFSEPVLLDLDVDYFDPPWNLDFWAPPWKTPAQLISALRRKGLRADWAGVCFSNRQGYLALWKRHLGLELIERLQNPGKAPSTAALGPACALISRKDFRRAKRALKVLPASPHRDYLLAFCGGRTSSGIYADAPLFDADWHQHRGLFEKSLALYERLRPFKSPRLRAFVAFQKGWAAWKLKDHARARAGFEEAGRLSTRDAVVQMSLAKIDEAEGDLGEALARYDRILGWTPEHIPARYNKGLLLMKLGRRRQAASCFLDAVSHEPEHAKSYHNLGEICLSRGQRPEAAALFGEFLRLWPEQDSVRAAVAAKLAAARNGSVPPLSKVLHALRQGNPQ